MTDLSTDATEAPGRGTGEEVRPTGWRFAVLVAVLAALFVGLVVAVVALNGRRPTYATMQIERMHDGCVQWVDEADGANRPDAAWCASMAQWMNGQMTSISPGRGTMMGRGGTMGSQMWQDPASMRRACEDWMTSRPDVGTMPSDSTAWCQSMTAWMAQRMGDWNGWMMNGAGGG